MQRYKAGVLPESRPHAHVANDPFSLVQPHAQTHPQGLLQALATPSARSVESTKNTSDVVDRTTHGNNKAVKTVIENPERPRCLRRPPFAWQLSSECQQEFRVSGDCGEIVTKIKDFREKDWVIPVGSTLRLMRGGLYRWTLFIERKAPHRPQMQLGVHGLAHRKPWRMLTTSRSSWARDDEAWCDRIGGDRCIEEGDFVHIEVDLRGLHLPFGTMSFAINSDESERVFDDIQLNADTSIMPVVSMGGDQSRIRLCPTY